MNHQLSENPSPTPKVDLALARNRAQEHLAKDTLPMDSPHVTHALVAHLNKLDFGEQAEEVNTRRFINFIVGTLGVSHAGADAVARDKLSNAQHPGHLQRGRDLFIGDENLVHTIRNSDVPFRFGTSFLLQYNIYMDTPHLFVQFEDTLGTQHAALMLPLDDGDCTVAYYTKAGTQNEWQFDGHGANSLYEFSSELLKG